MSCTVNHLLIERGVKLREIGHHVMKGRDKMEQQASPYDEIDRLRAVNAKLLKALELVAPELHSMYLHHEAFSECDFPECEQARIAIEEAK